MPENDARVKKIVQTMEHDYVNKSNKKATITKPEKKKQVTGLFNEPEILRANTLAETNQ